MAYNHQSIEKKWQHYWEENNTFSVDNASNPLSDKKKQKTFYALDMFPFPSGAGLHVGHPEGYTATDIICRKKRMEGYKVLHPMGWDAFGLPAENFAIKTGQHPEKSTNDNIKNFTRQIKSLGFSYDWKREFSTTDPSYYKWTQDLFLKFYEKGLLYEDEKNLNWCPSCKVVCANEEVEQGLHERCGNSVTKKSLKQWMFRITDYAERLLQDLENPNVVMMHGWGGTGSEGWFTESKNYLEKNGIEVIAPDFPNPDEPNYVEWKKVFEKEITPKLKSNSILLGHSSGASLIMKYAEEETLNVGEFIFVSPVLTPAQGSPDILVSSFFSKSFNYSKIKESANNIFIYGSDDDPYLPESDFITFEKELNADYRKYSGRGHFSQNDTSNPEILDFFEKTVSSILDWPEKIKAMQRNWIGKSEGAEVDFKIKDTKKKKNALILHGWENLGDPIYRHWQPWLKLELEKNGYEVFMPDFPNPDSPNLKEYLKYLEPYKEHMNENSIVIGHSMGGFIGAHFIENCDTKIDQFISISPCYNGWENEHYKHENFDKVLTNTLSHKYNYEKIKENVTKWKGLFSSNDGAIPVKKVSQHFDEMNIGYTVIENAGHFCKGDGYSEFPELLNEIIPKITVYTTRPDTLFGATYMVLAPENPLVSDVTTSEQKEAVEKYKIDIAAKSDLERTELNKDKTGVFTGAYAINPVNGKEIPIWIADYVMMGYGTGAIMAVPAHDERDAEFAKKFDLEIIKVVDGLDSDTQKKGGEIINSDFLNGMRVEKAIPEMITYLEKNNLGKGVTNYRLRDWIFTRQRYWGEPIPLVFDENGKCYPLDASELPVLLPETPNYEPSESGESPLAKIDDWVNVRGEITVGGTVKLSESGSINFRRETSTMPNWAGSSWYWLRFIDAKNDTEAWSSEAEKQWGPVDLYVGGAEHAVLHLLYARFWHKALYDMRMVTTKEPFKKLVNQGLILSHAYQRDGGGLVPTDEVEEKIVNEKTGEAQYYEISTGEEVKKIVAKMSKSLKNVVNPDEIVEAFGADTLRMYEMFMGPFEQNKAWETGAVEGVYKFLSRIHRYFTEKSIVDSCPSQELIKLTHQTVKKVSLDIDEFKFNTAISQMMIWMNSFSKLETIPRISGGKFVRLLAPFAPHLAEELWQRFKPEADTITFHSWPSYDESLLVEDKVSYAVQVNGKLRGDFEMSKDASKEDCITAAKEIEKVQKFLNEGEIKKEIFVPGKIVGFVVK